VAILIEVEWLRVSSLSLRRLNKNKVVDNLIELIQAHFEQLNLIKKHEAIVDFGIGNRRCKKQTQENDIKEDLFILHLNPPWLFDIENALP